MAARKKTSVSFADETIKIVEEFPSRNHGLENFSTKAEEIITDFSAMLSRTKKEILHLFSENELSYIYDMLNSSLILADQFPVKNLLAAQVEDADKYEGLGAKWEVSAPDLAKKISELTEFQAYTLAKMSDEFWAKNK
ncbi:hypothetical protein BR63_00045 [Thermanaerosceptrum fracticalcis]|uniref:Uncharacterized protein n=1 Tax=Thermanaerosceptrum fracticalcis TaxID=1712410 RepID=A0A7G6DYF7_THEFR|nr:hypothetical protein [Thermanaerosceptrum fracticalcis]QNB44861.1 hypothetical protein BR63_00045 [Thermanaerosceptrum fracticalcis]